MSRVFRPLQKKTLIVLLTALMPTGLYSCRNNALVTVNNKERNAAEKSVKVVEADNAFGFDLFKKIRSTSSEENLLVSPFSISVALAMAYNGADKDTKAEMEEVMRLGGLSKEQINTAYNRLISNLKSFDEKVVFEIANALYFDEGFTLQPDFLSVNRKVYGAEVDGLDFSSPAAVGTINSWVKNKTRGKIEQIVQQLKPLDRMVLLNAVYFYGTWSKQFDENGTHNRGFTKTGGTTIQVPMMNKLDTLPFVSSEFFKAIKIPYATGQFSMVVMLPHNENNTQDIINNLSAENWKLWMNNFKLTENIDVTMPRFKFAYETSLIDVLKEMGMQQAFLPKTADFSDISDDDLYISEVKHKSYIDVNETGTEAAAVTSVGFAATSFKEEPPTVPFYVDRPFLFVVIEKGTNIVLFLGEVQKPEY